MSDNEKAGGQVEMLTAPLREARRAFERNYIVAVLEQQRWNVPGTARVLGLQRPNLYRKARQLRIQLKNTGATR